MATPNLTPQDRAFFGHPRGLSTLFFTEMWERFSYYGMRALLVLFMTAPLAAGRPGLRRRDGAAPIYGLYTAMVYLMSAARRLDRRPVARPAPRGALRRHPDRRAATSAWRSPPIAFFYLGLVAHRARHRPAQAATSASIVGQLYAPEDTRRDAGFSIFYMGINLGRVLRAAGLRLPRARTIAGTGASAPPAWAWCWAWFSTCSAGERSGSAGLHPVPAATPDGARLSGRTALPGSVGLPSCCSSASGAGWPPVRWPSRRR